MQIKLFLFDQNGDISGAKGKEMTPGKCRFLPYFYGEKHPLLGYL